MLRNLSLKDFVIVRALDWDLRAGYTALTGETGAGKSILIDALQLLLGARAEGGFIREGAARAEISAHFDLPESLKPWMAQAGFTFEEGEGVLLRRVLDADGKSRAWINGSPALVSQLREAGEQLVEIFGQHGWQSLTNAAATRALLDSFAQAPSRAMQGAWEAARAARERLQSALSQGEARALKREHLAWQLKEAEKFAPKAGEWPELSAEHNRLLHAQALLEAAQAALDALEGESEAALPLAQAAASALERVGGIDARLASVRGIVTQAEAQLTEAGRELRAWLRDTESDDGRLAALDQRVSAWLALSRHHKLAPEELPARVQEWQAELAALEDSADRSALESEAKAREEEFLGLARQVSAARAAAAPKLSAAVNAQLQALGMGNGRFEVRLTPLQTPQAFGLEQIEFLVAGLAGSEFKPIARVASGGELSRLSLAIAVTTSENGAAQTLIFDEVDSGIGGQIAEAVGRLQRRLGQSKQVLSVTHLPQVAVFGHQHVVVRKQQQGGAAQSELTEVSGEARVSEIVRMLGGEKLGRVSSEHARQMLKSASEA